MKPGNADGGKGPQLKADGSMSAVWKRQYGDASEAAQTRKGRQTFRPRLNHRATPRFNNSGVWLDTD